VRCQPQFPAQFLAQSLAGRRLPVYCLLGCLIGGPQTLAAAGGDAAPLRDWLRGLTVMQADFRQVVTDESGKVLERAEGRMALHRPGRFRWESLRPYRQLLVVDGKQVWHYDPELEQVIVRDAGSTLRHTPAALLLGEERPERLFAIRALGAETGLRRWELRPRDGEEATGLHLLRVALERQRLAWMEWTDALGNKTRFEFLRQRRRLPPRAERELFSFAPPPGVDVIREQESQ